MENENNDLSLHPNDASGVMLALLLSNNAMLKTLLDTQAELMHRFDIRYTVQEHREKLSKIAESHNIEYKSNIINRFPKYTGSDV